MTQEQENKIKETIIRLLEDQENVKITVLDEEEKTA